MRYLSLLAFDVLLAAGFCTLTPGDAPDAKTADVVARVEADPVPIRVPGGPMLPPPASDVAVKLSADTLYVIDADVPVRVLSSSTSGGAVTVRKVAGPVSVYGRFVDGGGKAEFRTYSGKHVYFVTAAKSGPVELLVVPVGEPKPDDADVIRRTLDVDAGDGPRPPPGPEPKPPPPDPKPDPVTPAPIPEPGLRVLIVYDAATVADLPPAQNAILRSEKLWKFAQENCARGADGRTPEMRIYHSAVNASDEANHWKAAMARPRKSLPWILVSNGRTGYEGPLPATVDDTIALIRKYKD